MTSTCILLARYCLVLQEANFAQRTHETHYDARANGQPASLFADNAEAEPDNRPRHWHWNLGIGKCASRYALPNAVADYALQWPRNIPAE